MKHKVIESIYCIYLPKRERQRLSRSVRILDAESERWASKGSVGCG